MEHEWIAILVMPVEEGVLESVLVAGEVPPGMAMKLDKERSSVGCWRCEQPAEPDVIGGECPGEPVGYEQNGKPVYA